jgi:hypothetical protein
MAPAHEGHNSHSEESSAEEGRQIARWRILQQRILSSLADDYIAQCGRFAESEECKGTKQKAIIIPFPPLCGTYI